MKLAPDATNEVHDLTHHKDPGKIIITFITRLPSEISEGLTKNLKKKVQEMHGDPANQTPNHRGNIRAQTFEEGKVAMVVEPAHAFPPDIYIMDFFDVRANEICSRMHKHTGLRSVMIFTGPGTIIKTSSLVPMEIRDTGQQTIIEKDSLSGDIKYTFEVPENSIVAVSVPTGVSHQFNAVGPNAIIISTHVEEMTEVSRELMQRPNMMAQTIFLQETQPDLEQCGVRQSVTEKI